MIERDGMRLTIRPEKIRAARRRRGAAAPDAHVEPGTVEDVVYVGMITRYVIVSTWRQLVVARQNSGRRGRRPRLGAARSRLAWRPDQTFTITARGGSAVADLTRAANASRPWHAGLAACPCRGAPALSARRCGSPPRAAAAGGGTGGQQPGAAGTVPTTNLPVLKKIGKGEGQLNLIAWEGYLEPRG